MLFLHGQGNGHDHAGLVCVNLGRPVRPGCIFLKFGHLPWRVDGIKAEWESRRLRFGTTDRFLLEDSALLDKEHLGRSNAYEFLACVGGYTQNSVEISFV